MQGKGGRVRRIQVLHADVLHESDFSRRFVYLDGKNALRWKDGHNPHRTEVTYAYMPRCWLCT